MDYFVRDLADSLIRFGRLFQDRHTYAPGPDYKLSRNVGNRIKAERLRKNMTQQALASEINADKSTVSRNERGMNLTLDSLPLYAEKLGCSVNDLIPGYRMEQDESRSFDKLVEDYMIRHKLPPEEMETLLMKALMYVHTHRYGF